MVAAQRRTTLKAMVEHALRRELAPASEITNPDPEKFELGPMGYLIIKRPLSAPPVTLEMIQLIQDEIDEEDYQHSVNLNCR